MKKDSEKKSAELKPIFKTIKTPKHELKLEFRYAFVPMDKIIVKKELFFEMCKNGCRNFNNKYSCPPFAPNFSDKYKDYVGLFAVLLKIDLNQLKDHDYRDDHRLRLGNAVIKPRLEKVMRLLEEHFNIKYLSTGACRLCKPCKKKSNEPCKHPDKMRYSLEAMGVDCNDFVENQLGVPLLWYKDKTAPDYTSVVCALPLKKGDSMKDIILILEKQIEKLD